MLLKCSRPLSATLAECDGIVHGGGKCEAISRSISCGKLVRLAPIPGNPEGFWFGTKVPLASMELGWWTLNGKARSKRVDRDGTSNEYYPQSSRDQRDLRFAARFILQTLQMKKVLSVGTIVEVSVLWR